MVKLRKDPSKRQQEAPDPVEDDDVGGGGDNEYGEVDDFDNFLRTIDDSDEEDDEADSSEDDNGGDDDDEDNEDDNEEDMEPEEDEDLNEDQEEHEDGEEDSDEVEEDVTSDDQDAEEGEEGVPVGNQNGFLGGGGEGESDEGGDDGGEGASKMTAKKHKMDLEKLKETDPEFFAFLKQNDADLLEFDDSDEEGTSSEEDEEDALHKPPESLEEASDSEAEEERLDETSDDHKKKVEKYLKKGIVDINVISYWETRLSTTRQITVLTNVIEALQCAVTTLSEGGQSSEEGTLKWRVDGSANFNALLRLCIKEIKGFCLRFMCGNNNVLASEKRFDQKPFDVKDKSKQKWTRLRPKIKAYMEIMVQLFKSLGNPDAIASVLRHCLKMSGFWSLLAGKSFKILRALVSIWSQGEDSCRVIAFLTIIRMTNYCKDIYLVHMFKQMYISYVANCKFTSVNSWPAINFMRSSLVELYLLDTSLAYSVAFPFIRQLAIHLRNAMSPGSAQHQQQGQNDGGKPKKGEASRVVYSWQFVHSLHLWVDVLSQAGASEDDNLKLLIYPVVQICMGTIKLIATKKYIPIRFHIVRMLIKMQDKAGVFIPVLPLITEVLRMTNFSNKSATKFSIRPIDLSCCLKADSSETGFLKAVSENSFETILLYCKAIGTDLGYPEIVTPTVMYLKSFVKKMYNNPEIHKKFKVLLEKIQANSNYITEKRNKALEQGTITLADKKSHRIIQVQMQTSKPHPPILAFAAEHFKVNQKVQVKSKKPKLETREERLIPKPKAKQSGKGDEEGGRKKAIDFDKPMFESDSEEEDGDDDEDEFVTKLDEESSPLKKKKSKVLKKRKLQQNEDDGEGEDEEGDAPSKPKKKKNKKGKGKKKVNVSLDNENDLKDEVIDFELSD